MVELKQPFRCPSCGGPLAPPPVKDGPRPLFLAAGGVVALVAVGVVVWLSMASPPRPKPLPPAPPKPKPVAVAQPPATDVVGSSSPAGPTTVTIPPSLLPPPAATATVAPLAPTVPPVDTKSSLVSPDATLQAAPSTGVAQMPAAARPRHEHRIVATARSGLARQSAKATAGELRALDGSQPEYPAAYEDEDRKGQATVTCTVQADGHATRCAVVSQSGGAAFGESVLQWLAKDTTRFPPATRNRVPVAAKFTWNVQFDP